MNSTTTRARQNLPWGSTRLQRHSASLVISALLSLVCSSPAKADLSLSFNESTYSILAPGQTSLVSVYLTQTPGGIQIGPSNTLQTAAINLLFNSPSGIASVLAPSDIASNPLFDSTSASVSAISASLGEASIAGISDLSSPLLLGTFRLTGLAAGDTMIQVSSLGPGPSFGTSQGNVVDPLNMPAATATVVPEPPAAVLAMVAMAVCFVCRWRRRKAAA